MKGRTVFCFIFIAFYLIGCNTQEQSFYDQQFDLYIERYQEGMDKINVPYYIYAIDLDACSSCTPDHLVLIRELSHITGVEFLIIGDTSAWSTEMNGLRGLNNFQFDVEKRVHSFQTNFGKPMILFRNENKKTKRVEVLKDLDFELDRSRVIQILK